ncbi:unnamed protein product [Medioppia subpectinata]|uniref:protein-histidine N-methyltransferase n=1 Tax=Medioppia subpectinata TaxID=1979941 RepID=A0A7R9KDM7_9ACAR|nr:unnamed protein product [Medioppia subpectinata]CAG2101587.1 unnamed protein product [Medioppia subpectinata]
MGRQLQTMRNRGKRRSPQPSVHTLTARVAELGFKDNKRRLALIDELLKKCTYYNNNTTNCTQLLDEHKDINGLVDQIVAIERGITISLPKRCDDNWLAFKQWLNDNEIDVSKVDIKWWDDRQGFGLTALSDIKETEVFLEICRRVMITGETALKSDLNLASFISEDPVLQHMPNIVVALHVIDEYCKTDSFWRPYLQCLPSAYETALYLSDEDVNQLKGTQVLEEVVKMKRSIARQYAYFANQLHTNDRAMKLEFKNFFTYELYRDYVRNCEGVVFVVHVFEWDVSDDCRRRFQINTPIITTNTAIIATPPAIPANIYRVRLAALLANNALWANRSEAAVPSAQALAFAAQRLLWLLLKVWCHFHIKLIIDLVFISANFIVVLMTNSWAVSTVMTRQNAIPSCDGQSMTTALIPLWDMSNHKHGKLSTDYDLNTDSGVCRAMNDFNTGEQIFIYYGSRSNGEFFVHNGFVYDDNCNDFVPLRLGISRNDPLFQHKYDLCKKLDLNISGVFRLHHKCQPIDQNLLAFLRVFHFNKDEIEFWLQNENISDIYSAECKSLTHLNEKIQQFLSNRSALLLIGYPKPESQLNL